MCVCIYVVQRPLPTLWSIQTIVSNQFHGVFTILCTSHYNAVKYYMELKGRTVRKFGTVVGCGVLATAAVFVTIMLLGYATFGSNAQTLLLNNYNSTDAMANTARALTGLAIVSGYPLMFSGLKSSLHSLLGTVTVTNQSQNAATVVNVSVLSLLAVSACFVTKHQLATDIGVVSSSRPIQCHEELDGRIQILSVD